MDPGDILDTARLEARIPVEVREGLARKGHQVVPVSEWFARMGHAHGITLEDGTLRGGADPRGDGAALGF
jgi:gamma-glutamyltranspeptidase/glutathione hydrolase